MGGAGQSEPWACPGASAQGSQPGCHPHPRNIPDLGFGLSKVALRTDHAA